MTKAVQLDPAEWKALALTNVGQLHAFYSGIEAPSMQDLQTIGTHLDRMRSFAHAWHMSQRPQVQTPQQLQQEPKQVAAVSDIPGEKPARKGGWPLGKKRKRNGAAQQEHSA